jgi:hypothetical protein
MGGLGDPGWAGVVISLLVGAVIGYVYMRLSRERVQLLYRFVDTELVETKSDPTDPIQILFEDRPVPRVNKTVLYVWNAGRKTGEGSNVLARDPLRIAIPGDGHVLRARVLEVTRDVNNVTVQVPSDNQATIAFDFLDPGDGAAIEVIHTGAADERRLEGTLKGIPEGPKEDTSSHFEPRRISWGGVAVVVLSIVLGTALAVTENDAPSEEDQRILQIVDSLEKADRELMISYLEEWDALPEEQGSPDVLLLYLLLAGILVGGCVAIASAGSRSRPPRALLPSERKRLRRKHRDQESSSETTL